MLGLGFILAWIVVGLIVAFFAFGGGAGGARETLLHRQTRAGRRFWALALVAIYVGIGIAVPAFALVDDANDDEVIEGPGIRLTKTETEGREIFGQRCAQCHTLKASDAIAVVGPNLDELKPPASLTKDAIENGRSRGAGQMPADLLEGEDIDAVAAYVAKVAGK